MNASILKSGENLINKYAANPTLPFDLEGKLVEKNGKNIKVEKTVDNKAFQYSLRLKEEPLGIVGDPIRVDKSNIVSYNVEEKKEEIGDKEEAINVEKTLRELGLKYTSENIRMIESLLENGIKISRGNVDSYVKSREYLTKILDNIDLDKTIKLGEMGVKLEEDSLQKIAEALDEIEDDSFSIMKFLKLHKDLDYKQAEKISRDIYGQRMGKDIYDSIIALEKEKIPITKENIEKTIDTMKKINNLKNLEDKTYVKFIDGDLEFSIDNLYKVKNQYTSEKMEAAGDVSKFEKMTIASETSIDNLKVVLSSLGLEPDQENLMIIREFIKNDMDITPEKHKSLVDMKNGVKELLSLIRDQGVSDIIRDENTLRENIYSLVHKMKNKDDDLDKIQIAPKDEQVNTEETLKILGSIEDKELLDLIKKGQDFSLKNIIAIKKAAISTDYRSSENSLDYQVVERTDNIISIFRNLGDKLNASIIARSSHLNREISLEALDMASKQINIVEIRDLQREKIGFIQNEYTRIKNTLTTNVVRTSLIEGKSIQRMPLEQLNPYIEKSLNKYRETNKMTEEIRSIQGKEERIIPIIMRNNLDMTLKEIRDIDSFLYGEKNITKTVREEFFKSDMGHSEDFKEVIKGLQKRISDGIKRGELGKEDYNKLLNTMSGQGQADKDDSRERREAEHVRIKNRISRKDMIFQLPIEIGDEYKTLNIIVPNARAGINKDDMNFFLSLETKNIGKVNIDISVKNKNIYMTIDEDSNLLKTMLGELKASMKGIGYKLVDNSQVKV